MDNPASIIKSRHATTGATNAALGALATIFVWWVPALLPVVPLGILLSLAAWFFIIARLRNSGPEEFFEALALEAERARAERS